VRHLISSAGKRHGRVAMASPQAAAYFDKLKSELKLAKIEGYEIRAEENTRDAVVKAKIRVSFNGKEYSQKVLLSRSGAYKAEAPKEPIDVGKDPLIFPSSMVASKTFLEWLVNDMSDGPAKYTIPARLREELLRIALETDVVAEYRGIESWRIAAVSGARWLIRCAAECDDMPRMMHSTLRQIAELARRMSARSSEQRTKSGEMALELDKFLDDDE
jgi:hypothetical protein